MQRAAALLRKGRLVAFPTETVYGLGADARCETAVAAIYAVKGRPAFNPLIVHVSDLHDALEHGVFSKMAQTLAHHFWPGPLTLVVKRMPGSAIAPLCSAGLDTVALRSPAHPMARQLLARASIPVAAPSANRSGRVSPTEPAHVVEELDSEIAYLLEDGPCKGGIESTVLDVTGSVPRILRPGLVSPEEIRQIAGSVEIGGEGVMTASPGMLASHYAPALSMRLNAREVAPGEALLAFGQALPGAVHMKNLSPAGNLREAAANLFSMLRLLDKSGAAAIAVMPIPATEPDSALALAINDRLQRAAAPR